MDPKKIIEVWLKNERDPLLPKLQKAKIPYRIHKSSILQQQVHSESHQGVIAKVRGSKEISLETLFSKEKAFVLLLDRIYDPHNLGAIFRAAECFGITAIVWSKNRGTDLTPVVSKVSMGASELVPFARVSNLADLLLRMQKAGYHIYAANCSKKAQSVYKTQWEDKSVLILGSEGEGIQNLLLKKSDQELYIPMHGAIDSLNVSQAASVILSCAISQKGKF